MLGKKKQVARNALGAALILAFTAAPAAFAADERGWYMGANIGSAKAKDADASDISAKFTGYTTVSTTVDDTDTGYKILAGYQFNKTWAIEVGYVDLGKITADTTATGPAATYRQESEGKGWSLDGVGTLQMGEKTKLFAKLGAFRWDMDSRCVKLSGTGSCNAPTDRSASGTDLKYGVGFKYDFNKKVGLVVEWERYTDVGVDNRGATDKGKTGQSDMDFLSIGIRYNIF